MSNLVDRNQDKDPSTEYWSMQLLIKLGLVPDPDGEHDGPTMTKEEREIKLKEVGLFIP